MEMIIWLVASLTKDKSKEETRNEEKINTSREFRKGERIEKRRNEERRKNGD